MTTIFILLAVTACGAVQEAQEFNTTGNEFMTTLKEANYEAGYGLFAAELQSEVGSVMDLQGMIENNNARPNEWTFSSWNISTDENQNNLATVEGSVIFQDNRKGTIKLELVKVGEAWKIISFDLSW
jgi:hypothetical protein